MSLENCLTINLLNAILKRSLMSLKSLCMLASSKVYKLCAMAFINALEKHLQAKFHWSFFNAFTKNFGFMNMSSTSITLWLESSGKTQILTILISKESKKTQIDKSLAKKCLEIVQQGSINCKVRETNVSKWSITQSTLSPTTCCHWHGTERHINKWQNALRMLCLTSSIPTCCRPIIQKSIHKYSKSSTSKSQNNIFSQGNGINILNS